MSSNLSTSLENKTDHKLPTRFYTSKGFMWLMIINSILFNVMGLVAIAVGLIDKKPEAIVAIVAFILGAVPIVQLMSCLKKTKRISSLKVDAFGLSFPSKPEVIIRWQSTKAIYIEPSIFSCSGLNISTIEGETVFVPGGVKGFRAIRNALKEAKVFVKGSS